MQTNFTINRAQPFFRRKLDGEDNVKIALLAGTVEMRHPLAFENNRIARLDNFVTRTGYFQPSAIKVLNKNARESQQG